MSPCDQPAEMGSLHLPPKLGLGLEGQCVPAGGRDGGHTGAHERGTVLLNRMSPVLVSPQGPLTPWFSSPAELHANSSPCQSQPPDAPSAGFSAAFWRREPPLPWSLCDASPPTRDISSLIPTSPPNPRHPKRQRRGFHRANGTLSPTAILLQSSKLSPRNIWISAEMPSAPSAYFYLPFEQRRNQPLSRGQLF